MAASSGGLRDSENAALKLALAQTQANRTPAAALLGIAARAHQ